MVMENHRKVLRVSVALITVWPSLININFNLLKLKMVWPTQLERKKDRQRSFSSYGCKIKNTKSGFQSDLMHVAFGMPGSWSSNLEGSGNQLKYSVCIFCYVKRSSRSAREALHLSCVLNTPRAEATLV